MTHTIFRLVILFPAAVLLIAIGVLGLRLAGLSVTSASLAALVICTPLALIGWTLVDHRRRTHERNDSDA